MLNRLLFFFFFFQDHPKDLPENPTGCNRGLVRKERKLKERHMEGTRFRLLPLSSLQPYIWKDLERKFTMAVPHVQPLAERKQFCNEEAIGAQKKRKDLAVESFLVSPQWVTRHVCSTCEAEIKTEEDVPVGKPQSR